MGARAYRRFAAYDPDPGWVVEVGSERGEGSTGWLHRYATDHGLYFATIDVHPGRSKAADRIAPGHARCAQGRDELRRIRPISVAYLDGFDWIPSGHERSRWIATQRDEYTTLGYELTNENAQREMLEEAHQVVRNAAPRCAVICDDTWGRWNGKGGWAVPYLRENGFRLVSSGRRTATSLGYAYLIRD